MAGSDEGSSPTLVFKKVHLASVSAMDVVIYAATISQTTNEMQLKTILNYVEKQKGFVYTHARFSEDGSSILVDIQPHGRSRPVCSGCGKKGAGYDRLAPRHFEFVPLWAIPVFFVYAMRRVDCPNCGVKVEKVPWADGKH